MIQMKTKGAEKSDRKKKIRTQAYNNFIDDKQISDVYNVVRTIKRFDVHAYVVFFFVVID